MLTIESTEEYKKWLDVVKNLEAIGVNINMQDKLNKALIAWAEAFHVFKSERGE